MADDKIIVVKINGEEIGWFEEGIWCDVEEPFEAWAARTGWVSDEDASHRP